MTLKSQIGFLFFLLALAPARADDTFPQPPELQPDVDFWVSIFTEFTTGQGVLHDARDLAVVYGSIDFAEGTGSRERQRIITARRKAIQSVLATLASGKRDNLSAEEARILALFPDGVDSKTLVAASRNIRYQQGLRDRFREGLVRAGRWRDFIAKELTALGVPVDLAALPHVESSYNPAARSHVGASGIWQFTRSTGRRFMRVDHVVDERNDPFSATRAAGRLLAYNYSITGNWPMAITAYNHGLAGVRRAMRQFGDTAYADILRNYKGRTFGFASRNFYVAFLAAREVDQNVEKYFPGLEPEQPANYVHVTMPDYIAVEDLSAALGVTTRQFAAHNPALQGTVLQASKHVPKGFEVRLPSSLVTGTASALLAGIPPDRWQAAQLPDLFHTVQRGDTLSQIAEAYKTRVSTLVALNNLSSSHRIRAGQRLRLPAAGPAPVSAPAPVAVAALAPTEAAALEVSAAPEEAAAPEGGIASMLLGTIQTALLSDPSDYSVAADNTIEIQPLETLGHFADWLEIRTQRLRDINGLAFRTPVEVGKRLRLDLGKVDAKTFEDRRVAWHREQQDSFFRQHVIAGMQEHVIERGESIWILARREYDVPMWLLRQYNPGVDLHSITPGTTVRFPVLQAVDAS
jgi:membrane-bound lytic murein transglycosylase D